MGQVEQTYIAQVGLTNDKSGKRWQTGDVVQAGDFAKYIIEDWLRLGILKPAEVDDGSNSHNG